MATSQKEWRTADQVATEFGEAAGVCEGAVNAGEEMSSVATATAEKAHDAASFVGEKAEQATEAIGAGMESLGGAIRDHKPQSGVLCNAGTSLADTLEGGGRYLEERGLKGMADDVTSFVRKNPIPALLVGIGVGFLLARIVRR